ncbi:hypothetical protein H4R99_006524 [Coemansia sp. RSA 1722]|nr:hypothetical protein H4R99_006524 [Coemansia sp. RSA 1722]
MQKRATLAAHTSASTDAQQQQQPYQQHSRLERTESAKRPASRTTHAAHIQPNKVTLQAATTSSRYTRPDSAASNKSTGATKPLAAASADPVSSRPIATARARRQASNVGPEPKGRFDTRGLRRYRSDEQARSRSPSRSLATAAQQQQQPSAPVRVFGASKNAAAAQPISFSGRQQSESSVSRRMRPPASPASQPRPLPASRTPSRTGSVRGSVLGGAGNIHPRAPSVESTTPRAVHVGRTARPGMAAPASNASTPVKHPMTRPPPSPSAVSGRSDSRARASRIPRLAGYVESEAAAESRRRLLEENRVLTQQLAVEQNSNNELLKDFKDMASAFQTTTAQLEEAVADRIGAESRISALQVELGKQRAASAELHNKLDAMAALLHAQELERSSVRGLPSPSASQSKRAAASYEHDADSLHVEEDWHKQLEKTQACVAEGHAHLLLQLPDSEIDSETRAGLNALDRFVGRKGLNGEEDVVSRQFVQQASDASSTLVHKRTPQQRRVDEEERAKRRRSTMLFAGLIEPSSGSRGLLEDDPPSVDAPSCARCVQLLDTMQLLEVDNDYYREANAKLRDNITDVVSKHNALVRYFEKERQQRREAKAQALAEAMRAAAHERAMIEAQQKAHLDARTAEDSELSSQFDRSLRIATRG